MKLVPATSDDAPYLAAILFRAFAEDLLLIGTCYPDTPANRGWWAKRIASQMQHANTRVTKVIDDATGVIVAWAKWLVYRPGAEKGTGAVNPEVEPSKDTNLEACRKLADGQYKMLEAVMGQRGYIWLNAMATDPTHQRKDAATALVAEGCDWADDKGLELFSACTGAARDNTRGIFEKHRIKVVAEEDVVQGMKVYAGHRAAKTS